MAYRNGDKKPFAAIVNEYKLKLTPVQNKNRPYPKFVYTPYPKP